VPEAAEQAAGAPPETQLDLRGLLCPLTWAKTRYALSRLPAGGLLRVVLDHRPAVPDIKRNAEELGHEVLSARELGAGVWELRLKRSAS
jgi:tRNA 2-thiouridine synthesizing protein A